MTQAPTTLDSGPAPLDDVTTARLARLAQATRRRRAAGDRRLIAAETAFQRAGAALTAVRERIRRLRDDEHRATALAEQAPNDVAEPDGARRGLSNGAYLTAVLVVWTLNIPVGITAFQVFEEPMTPTVILALLADTVLLGAAHAAGVSLRRGHAQADAAAGLGVEYGMAWSLFGLGLLMTGAQAWVRWRYLALTGSAAGIAGIAFGTLLIAIGFVVTVWCAFRHHHPGAGVLEAVRRRMWWARRSLARAERRGHRRTARLHKAWNRRRHLAQHVVAGADRIAAQGRHSGGTARSPVVEPGWLASERALAGAPGPADSRPMFPPARPAITPDESDPAA